MNVKKTVAILIGIVLIAFGIGFLALNYGDNQNISISPNEENGITKFFGKNMVKENIDEEKIETVDEIKNIDIETPFVDVNIITENRKDIRIHYNGSLKANYIPELKTKKNANTLYITAKKEGINSYSVSNSNLKLDIYVPMDFKDNIKITTSSGDIGISNLKLHDVDIVASSGNININNLSTESLSVETSSGDQKFKGLESKKSSFLASSGDIEIYGSTGDTDATTSSGDINLNYDVFNNNITIVASSGDVDIVLPKDAEFNINASTTSGDIESSFPVTVTGKLKNNLNGKVGNSNNTININTTSGDISIEK